MKGKVKASLYLRTALWRRHGGLWWKNPRVRKLRNRWRWM